MERRQELVYVDKVNSSHLLRDCETLRRLLQFFAEESLRHPDASLKEQDIAEKVFGETLDFDPRIDSKVRVQIKRLRERLAKYYEENGAEDEIVLQIPAGSYHLRFLYRSHVPKVEIPTGSAAAKPPHSRNIWTWAAGACLLILSVVMLAGFFRARPEPDPVLKTFWRPFLANDTPPLVIYGNSQYYDLGGTLRGGVGETPDGSPVNDSFTGVGEVIAAAELATLFYEFDTRVAFRRSLNVSWEEAKDNNLIFVGAFATAIKALPTPEKFALQNPILQTPGEVRTRIVNLKPGPAEAAYFAASPSPCCRATTQDHALITFSPALSPKRFTLLIAGATTLGTQEAVTFLCRPSSVRALLARLPAMVGNRPPYFEAVLRARISGGAPVHSEIVALHVRNDTK